MSEREICAVFATNLRSFMSANNMTQRELATKTGAGASTVNDWVKGRRIPRSPMLQKLADVFGCALSQLLLPPVDASSEETALSPEEREVIALFRLATKDKQAAIRLLLQK